MLKDPFSSDFTVILESLIIALYIASVVLLSIRVPLNEAKRKV